jgi:hypothetical protein
MDPKTSHGRADPFEESAPLLEGANGHDADAPVEFEDYRFGTRDGAVAVEFSWQGFDEGHETCGRGWGVLTTAGTMEGRLFIHQGDESTFKATLVKPDAGDRGRGSASRRPTNARKDRSRPGQRRGRV